MDPPIERQALLLAFLLFEGEESLTLTKAKRSQFLFQVIQEL
jgi:hypothetical protein